MNINYKKLIIFMTLVVLLLGAAAVSAADTNDTTTDATTNDASVSTQTQKIADTPANDENVIVEDKNTDNKIMKEKKTVKTTLNTEYVYPNNFASKITDEGTYSNTEFIFSGTFSNLGSYTLNLENVIFTIEYDDARFTGTTFTLKGTNYNVSGLIIDNSASPTSLDDSAITIRNSEFVNIKLNDISYTKASGDVHGISVFESDNVNVTNNSVTVTGLPQSMGWNNDSGVYSGAVAVSGIVVGNAPYVNVTNNTIVVQSTTPSVSDYTTNEGLTIKNENTQHVMAINNTINVTGAQYNYGTTISDSASHILIDNNTFNMTGAIYNCGIQFDNSNSSDITHNHIYCVSNGVSENPDTDAMCYGIINTCWYKPKNIYVDIKHNYINLTANINYGMELYLTGYSTIQNNTIICDGKKSMGIGAYQVDNTDIIENHIHAKGTTDAVNNIVEVITPNNYGIYTASCTTTKVNGNYICEHNSVDLTDVYAIYSPNAITEINNNYVCVCKTPQDKKTVTDSIYAPGTPQSGNAQYDCSNCNCPCTSQPSQSQSPTVLSKIAKKSVKSEVQAITITADNFAEYVTDGVLNDNVNDGDTLDFQGIFYGPKYALNIDKPVNIISSTNDAYICLDTANNDFFGVEVGDSYTVSRGGSGTNITGIYFNNTQLFVKNADNVTLNNITVNNENLQLGSGVGVTSIRDNSSNIQVLNSYFRTKDNGGHSTLVCGWANNVLIENCTIETEGRVGNMFYATTYNVNGVEVAAPYANNNITFRNNYINGLKANVEPICYAIALEGKGHVFENNLIEYYGSCIMPQWGYGNVSDITFKNNTIPYGTCQIGYRNSTVTDNTMNFSTLEKATVKNNKFGSVNIFNNVNFMDNIVGTINGINGKENVTIVNNFIDTLNINDNSTNYYVANNTIYSPESYAVNIKKGCKNITLENNFIASKDKNSTEAINNQTEYTSTNNDGLIIYHITDEDYLNAIYAVSDINSHPDELIIALNIRNGRYEIHMSGFKPNSIVFADFDFDFGDNNQDIFILLQLRSQPKIFILNASKTNQLVCRPISLNNFTQTTLVTDSYLPSLERYQLAGAGTDVDIPYKFADSIMGNFTDSTTSMNCRFYNITTISDSGETPTVDIINTSVEVSVADAVAVGEDVTIDFAVIADGTALDSGKIVVFDKLTKYGEVDIVDGVASLTTSFDSVGNYSLIAYYVGEGDYNSSNAKFNVTVKVLEATVTVEPLTIEYGTPATVTAVITTEDGAVVDTGKVAFRVNGKVLRDANNKVVYVDVVDGTAVLDDFTVDSADNGTIEAVYKGKINYDVSSVVSNYTVTAAESSEPALVVDDITATAGSDISFDVSVVNVSDLNAGKVVVKINGKTVKNVDTGKLYAKVVDGVASFTYTLPSTVASGEYDIKATYTSGSTKLTAESVLTVE
ncbi:MAG: hypothetical protein BZ136_05675 [Methanosphaera sp. rholeuAM74]|nr:MAG: hypothetical protein BZ136_05675 [Methanosphaera sp. rholeuAM74]